MTGNEVIAAIETLHARPRFCELCGRPSTGVHVFYPSDSSKYGAPPGKQRVILLLICETCEREPLENLEEAILELVERRLPG